MYVLVGDKKYNIILMNTFFLRLKGLMFRKEFIKDVYMFPRCSSIHTFFMKQNIDVCMLNKDYVVTFVKCNVGPRDIIIRKGYYTLEMPVFSCKDLKIGDVLDIKK